MDNQLFGQYLIQTERLRHDNVLVYLALVSEAAKDLGIREDALYGVSNPVILSKVVEKLNHSKSFAKRTKTKREGIQAAVDSLVRYKNLTRQNL